MKVNSTANTVTNGVTTIVVSGAVVAKLSIVIVVTQAVDVVRIVATGSALIALRPATVVVKQSATGVKPNARHAEKTIAPTVWRRVPTVAIRCVGTAQSHVGAAVTKTAQVVLTKSVVNAMRAFAKDVSKHAASAMKQSVAHVMKTHAITVELTCVHRVRRNTTVY